MDTNICRCLSSPCQMIIIVLLKVTQDLSNIPINVRNKQTFIVRLGIFSLDWHNFPNRTNSVVLCKAV